MTIKKPMKLKSVSEAPAAAPESAESPAVGGATIADRFKLDVPDPNATKPKAGVGTTIALVAALAGLAAAGFLVFTLWKHWEFLMPA